MKTPSRKRLGKHARTLDSDKKHFQNMLLRWQIYKGVSLGLRFDILLFYFLHNMRHAGVSIM